MSLWRNYLHLKINVKLKLVIVSGLFVFSPQYIFLKFYFQTYLWCALQVFLSLIHVNFHWKWYCAASILITVLDGGTRNLLNSLCFFFSCFNLYIIDNCCTSNIEATGTSLTGKKNYKKNSSILRCNYICQWFGAACLKLWHLLLLQMNVCNLL